MARTTRTDWLSAGLAVLRDEGERALTIERLCTTLDRTKGAFYHHFGGLDGFVEALLTHWSEEMTERIIREAEAERSPSQRGARLSALVLAQDHHIDRAIRAWSLRDERARAAMRRVDQRRAEFLTELHRAQGHPDPEALGQLEYAAFVGAQQLQDSLPSLPLLEKKLQRALALLAAASG